jgi:hypothetical protein
MERKLILQKKSVISVWPDKGLHTKDIKIIPLSLQFNTYKDSSMRVVKKITKSVISTMINFGLIVFSSVIILFETSYQRLCQSLTTFISTDITVLMMNPDLPVLSLFCHKSNNCNSTRSSHAQEINIRILGSMPILRQILSILE